MYSLTFSNPHPSVLFVFPSRKQNRLAGDVDRKGEGEARWNGYNVSLQIRQRSANMAYVLSKAMKCQFIALQGSALKNHYSQ